MEELIYSINSMVCVSIITAVLLFSENSHINCKYIKLFLQITAYFSFDLRFYTNRSDKNLVIVCLGFHYRQVFF